MKTLAYLGSIALPPLVMVGLWVVLFHYQLGVPVERHLAKRGLRWEEKVNLVERFANRQKLVIISGSNSYISLAAKTIERQLKVVTVNAALMASFGVRYYVESLSPYLRSGDTVVLPLEYFFYDSRYAGKDYNFDTQLFVLRQDPDYYRGLSLDEKLGWLINTHPASVAAAVAVKTGLSPPPQVTTRPKNRGWRGDVLSEFVHKPKLFNKIKPVSYRYDGQSVQLERLAAFVTWARRNNVQVVAAYPSHLSSATVKPPAADMLASIEAFWRGLGVPVLGQPQNSYYKPRHVFDTAYHLTNEGRKIHTQQFIDLLCDAVSEGRVTAQNWGASCER
ncbi:MAG: hypothetical protein HOC23_17415 [Halieaceae bacterium]|jgi:hypothetical protein|nr:hypothetical protein [Halieaceae bacterium]